MIRPCVALIAVAGALAVVPYAVEAQKPTQKKDAPTIFNQVYVKIILPTDSATRDKDVPVVETWIADQLKKRGQSKFTAATAWAPLIVKVYEPTEVWNANLDNMRWGCPVGAYIERADGRIKVHLAGWSVAGIRLTVSLTDEPGSREIAAVEELKDDSGLPYVAVLIGPPPEKTAAPTDDKK